MKENFVILVGSDGAGKSTIARYLSMRLGYPVEHHGPVKSHNEGFNEYFGEIERINYSVIKDRFHEGERIFAPIYRGYEAEYFPELEKRLMEKFNVLLVLVYAPFDVVLERIEKRGEDFVKPEHFRYCHEKVMEIFNESDLPKMIIDTSDFSPDYNVEKIVKKLIL